MLAKEKYERTYHDFVRKIVNDDIYMSPYNQEWQTTAAKRLKMLQDFSVGIKNQLPIHAVHS